MRKTRFFRQLPGRQEAVRLVVDQLQYPFIGDGPLGIPSYTVLPPEVQRDKQQGQNDRQDYYQCENDEYVGIHGLLYYKFKYQVLGQMRLILELEFGLEFALILFLPLRHTRL